MYIRPITKLLLIFGLVNILIGGAGAYISFHYVFNPDNRVSDIARSNMTLSNVVFYIGIAVTILGAICFMVDYQDHIMDGFFDDGGKSNFLEYR